MKDLGIWLDQREAFIIPGDGSDNITIIPSEIEETHPVGGYGSSDKHLAQVAVSTSKHTARKKQQMHEFFHQVLEKISDAEYVYIIGPGETRKLFSKHASEHHVKAIIAAVEPCDSITHNQMREKVREFFNQYHNKS